MNPSCLWAVILCMAPLAVIAWHPFISKNEGRSVKVFHVHVLSGHFENHMEGFSVGHLLTRFLLAAVSNALFVMCFVNYLFSN